MPPSAKTVVARSDYFDVGSDSEWFDTNRRRFTFTFVTPMITMAMVNPVSADIYENLEHR